MRGESGQRCSCEGRGAGTQKISSRNSLRARVMNFATLSGLVCGSVLVAARDIIKFIHDRYLLSIRVRYNRMISSAKQMPTAQSQGAKISAVVSMESAGTPNVLLPL